MQNRTTLSTKKTHLKDYSPTWQPGQGQREVHMSTPGLSPKKQGASDVPVIDLELSEQETQPSIAAPKAAPVSPLPASAPTVKLPATAIHTRWFRGKYRRNQLMCAGLCVAVLLIIGSVYTWLRIKSLPPTVTDYQVSAQNIAQQIGGGGIVYPLQEEDISYPITERAISVLVAPGDHVTANQPLIQLDITQLNAEIDQAYSDVLSTADYLKSVKASGTAYNVAQAQQSYDLARNKYASLKAEASSSTLHNGTVISPINGVVTSLLIAPGEIFAANRTLIVIMDESTVIVRAQVPLIYLGQLHVGQPATVIPSSLPGVTIPGKISAIIPRADPQTDTFEIWVAIPNPNQMLLPGMSAFVHMQQAGKVLAVPRLAVLNPDREGIVFVERDGHVYIQKVQVVARTVKTIYIGSGISAGDRVILVGLDSLQNGEKVRVSAVES
jgi:RND family efflux transporter MFP subunit